jgi:DNA gyrase subunit B
VARRDGVERELRLSWDLVTSAEYRALAVNATGREALATPSFLLQKDEGEPTRHEQVEALLESLFDSAKKGLAIQRYKGLGEMNPEQLWETTMDPDRRRLLQVRVEDDYTADEMFTILMGDQVEPRRDFIEKNALLVQNLDI